MGNAITRDDFFNNRYSIWWSMGYEKWKDPKTVPDNECEITHDAHKGFEGQRVERGEFLGRIGLPKGVILP